MPPVEFPDAEALVVAFLNDRVTPPVSTKVRKTRPKRFVRVYRTGGTADNRAVERAQITVSCTAGTSVTASDDARACRSAFLNEYTAMPLVRRVEEVTAPYYDPDPDTNEDRYTFTVLLTIRGAR